MTTDMHPAHPTGSGDRAAHLRWQRMWSHREQLLKVARRRSMSAEDAEDAVQEAMLRGAQNTHLDEARLGAWLTTVTMRLCVDRYRQVHREAEVGSAPKLTVPGPVPVEEAVCDRAEARWVAYRSRELPARQAQALRLKSEDRDVEEIAREMGLSCRAVESLLARARRTLRNSLAGTLALGLWLIGRGRDQAGQAGVPAHALAATSAAATLAVVGLIIPFAYESAPARPAPPATSEGVDVTEENAGYTVPAAAPSVRPANPAGTASPSPGALPGESSPVTVPVPAVTLPEAALQKVTLQDVALPTADLPAVPAPPAPSLPPLPATPAVSVPPLPIPDAAVPDAPALPEVSGIPRPSSDVPDELPHTSVRP
ncbi:sigma-70 family RNA polymerase sigma factor [Streptomyces sp. ISL-36]|uniref:RNA polymerase sigma factor n=1 Tax=Streptomyces sp. ISL-36 TaxID=2819182 RepID=UPI001BEC05DB|nr:sigma-70 family RNA polymerase sigma factor [Streptomyces sp. ISL-36]MBT2443571.1 sigma-70 family RNA polymerase sigma factor [Streptomyces sp. ISL-36]